MPVRKLREFLDLNRAKYVAVSHSPAFTAQEIAASAHIPGRELAKAVMVKIDGRLAIAVLPATAMIDFAALRAAAAASKVELAGEDEFRDKFPGCELGAMPPFGNLYGMDTFVAHSLSADDEIAFNAGSHTELIRMGYADFARLAQPRVARFESRKA
jgi:Ala-tRNA(Pro) deacylase